MLLSPPLQPCSRLSAEIKRVPVCMHERTPVADIFISYSSDDRPRIERIAQALIDEGWSVWWDRKLGAGNIFRDKIAREMEASKCVLVVWTASSVTSQWVLDEAGY